MNLILLSPADFVSDHIVELTGRRLSHVLEIIKPKLDDQLVVGFEGGNIGRGRILSLDGCRLRMSVALDQSPPEKLPVVLCLALMRPIVLKRVLMNAASLGVAEIVIFHSRQVEKSFWQSTALSEEGLREQLILGLEQAKDTVLPKVLLFKRFKPFVEDVLPGLLAGRQGVVADPSGEPLGVGKLNTERGVVLLVGPEGGFIPFEIDKLRAAGCQVAGLGQRILKVETAVTVMLTKLFY